MYSITKNNVVSVVKGDTIRFPIELFIGKFPYKQQMELEDGDKAYFGIFDSNTSFDQAVIKKVLTKDDEDEYGNLWITLLPEDTINLEVGTYYYEVKVLYNDKKESNNVDTVIQRTKFIVLD